jgi:hypothetical protein
MKKHQWQIALDIAFDNTPKDSRLIDLRLMPGGEINAIYLGEPCTTSHTYEATIFIIQPEMIE